MAERVLVTSKAEGTCIRCRPGEGDRSSRSERLLSPVAAEGLVTPHRQLRGLFGLSTDAMTFRLAGQMLTLLWKGSYRAFPGILVIGIIDLSDVFKVRLVQP